MHIRKLSTFAALVGLAVAPSAQGMVRAPQTTTPGEIIEVAVTITDSKMTLSDYAAERGAQVDFHVTNKGRRVHNFVSAAPGLRADQPRVEHETSSDRRAASCCCRYSSTSADR